MRDHASARALFGDFLRLAPISAACAVDRGTPIDRYYVERWFASMRAHLQGRILLVGDHGKMALGGHVDPRGHVRNVSTDGADVVADLGRLVDEAAGTFDCLVMPHVLQAVFDGGDAVRMSHQLLTPGGMLLATLPGITPHGLLGQEREDSLREQCWSFTSHGARQLFEAHFPSANVSISAQGNVLAATALMQGLSASELTTSELDAEDASYEVVIGVCARRS